MTKAVRPVPTATAPQDRLPFASTSSRSISGRRAVIGLVIGRPRGVVLFCLDKSDGEYSATLAEANRDGSARSLSFLQTPRPLAHSLVLPHGSSALDHLLVVVRLQECIFCGYLFWGVCVHLSGTIDVLLFLIV